MKNQLAVISSPEFGEIRNVMVASEPWFVAKDVCDILGIQNARDTVKKLLDDDEKGVDTIYVRSENGVIQQREVNIVSESGLYHLIFVSRKPEAKTFRKWVTKEVLPNIRKHGFYMTPETAMSLKTAKRTRKQMLELMQKNLTEEDIRKCRRRFGMADMAIRCMLRGTYERNDAMAYLQQRAMANRERWFDAYEYGRMTEVLNALNGI